MADDVQYLIKISDDAGKNKVILTLDPPQVEGVAADFIFNYIGNPNKEKLIQDRSLGQEYMPHLDHLKDLIFDNDDQGLFIRDGIDFVANGQTMDPDAPFKQCFVAKESNGHRYFLADLVVKTPQGTFEDLKQKEMRAYQCMYTMHRIYKGFKVDVTREDAFLAEIIKELEDKGLLEVDVASAAWRLTEKGREAHKSMIEEARELIRRYDLYADVDFDRDSTPIFGTGTGKDLRVPMYEFMGINPFRARFVLGINDAEFENVPDWPQKIVDPGYFDAIFAPIEQAPGVEDIGREKLEAIVREGNASLREQRAEAEYRERSESPEYEVVTVYEYNDPYFDRSRWWRYW